MVGHLPKTKPIPKTEPGHCRDWSFLFTVLRISTSVGKSSLALEVCYCFLSWVRKLFLKTACPSKVHVLTLLYGCNYGFQVIQPLFAEYILLCNLEVDDEVVISVCLQLYLWRLSSSDFLQSLLPSVTQNVGGVTCRSSRVIQLLRAWVCANHQLCPHMKDSSQSGKMASSLALNRITEWWELEGTSVGHLVQPPCWSRVTYSRHHRMLPRWVLIQRRRLHNLPGKLVRASALAW